MATKQYVVGVLVDGEQATLPAYLAMFVLKDGTAQLPENPTKDELPFLQIAAWAHERCRYPTALTSAWTTSPLFSQSPRS